MHENELIFTMNGLTNRLTFDQYLAKHELLIFHRACNYQFDYILIAYLMKFKSKFVSLFEITARILAVTINFSLGSIPFPLIYCNNFDKNSTYQSKNRLSLKVFELLETVKLPNFYLPCESIISVK